MISQKAKYAFKALAHLAGVGPGISVQIEEIAGKSAVPRKFLEHILLDLKRKGIVASRRGRAGGYLLIKHPSEITIGQILRAIDGPIAPLPCISRTAYRRYEWSRPGALRQMESSSHASIDGKRGKLLPVHGSRGDEALAETPCVVSKASEGRATRVPLFHRFRCRGIRVARPSGKTEFRVRLLTSAATRRWRRGGTPALR